MLCQLPKTLRNSLRDSGSLQHQGEKVCVADKTAKRLTPRAIRGELHIVGCVGASDEVGVGVVGQYLTHDGRRTDRKSTRLNSSHVATSYAVFCLKKKKKKRRPM